MEAGSIANERCVLHCPEEEQPTQGISVGRNWRFVVASVAGIAVVGTLFLFSCASPSTVTSLTVGSRAVDLDEESSKTRWSYERTADWADGFPGCTGAFQSPINIVPTQTVPDVFLQRINYTYVPVSGLEVQNVLEMPAKGEALTAGHFGNITIDGNVYDAIQFHFHHSSDHQINGRNSAAEMHIVHVKRGCAPPMCLVVIGILIEVSQDAPLEQDPAEFAFFNNLGFGTEVMTPNGANKVKEPVDLNALAWQLQGDYYQYQGGLTTPPCAEHVLWFVMKEKAVMTQKMIDMFPNPGNHRPVNGLHGRQVLKSMFGPAPMRPPPGLLSHWNTDDSLVV